MNIKPTWRGKRILVLSLLPCILSSGCQSFVGHELPRYAVENIQKSNMNPPVSCSLAWRGRADDSGGDYTEYYSKMVRDVLIRSGLFSEVCKERDEQDIHLDMALRVEHPISKSEIVSLMTLCILPGYAQSNYGLSVDVKVKNKIHHYLYTEHVNNWTHLIFFFYPQSTLQIKRQIHLVVEILIMNLLHDMSEDGLL